jgi:hypothetical protein
MERWISRPAGVFMKRRATLPIWTKSWVSTPLWGPERTRAGSGSGAGGPGDQAVAVQHGQGRCDLEAGGHLLALDGPAQRGRRLGEPVAGGQPGKPLVHPPLLARRRTQTAVL